MLFLTRYVSIFSVVRTGFKNSLEIVYELFPFSFTSDSLIIFNSKQTAVYKSEGEVEFDAIDKLL
jgi:hypothetical protein